MLSGVAQRNTPELPPYCLCFHSTTSSRFFIIFFVRMTPIGLPVHLIRLPSNDHVSSWQLTFTKSSLVIGRQPASVPVMSAWVTGLSAGFVLALSAAWSSAWPSVMAASVQSVGMWISFIVRDET